VVAESATAVILLTVVAALFVLCIWIVVPPPNGVAIVTTVVSIELSPYLLLLNVALLAAILRSPAQVKTAAIVIVAINIILCSLPLGAVLRSGTRLEWPMEGPGRAAVAASSIPIRLGDDRSEILAYLPATGSKHPIVFTIYGGAWERGSPDKDSSLDRALAADGYAVFALDYRHSPAYRYPVALDDVRSEVANILKDAPAYRADRTRVAILGHSSGGELAELCAFTPNAPFRALISYSGAIDLLKGYEILPRPDPIDVRSVIVAYMGSTPAENTDRYRSASPIYQVRRGLPPTLLIYADRDHVVDFGYAETFRDALRADGDDVTLVELPWAEHGYEEVPFGLHAPIALHAVEVFLQRTLRR
jgi:acetyl esterase/lipase